MIKSVFVEVIKWMKHEYHVQQVASNKTIQVYFFQGGGDKYTPKLLQV